MATPDSIVAGAALPLDLLAQSIPMLTRSDLEALTEHLIDALDRMDGDCDLEDGDDDDQCDDEGFGEGAYKTRPKYGIDQTLGPINEEEASRAHRAEMLAEPVRPLRRPS